MLACQHDDYELATWTLRRLLKQKVEVNARDAMGRTALMHLLGPHSAGPYQSEMLERLLEAGADPCAADNVGRTVLHYAAEGYTHAAARQAAELLFDFGRPDVSSADNEGRTPDRHCHAQQQRVACEIFAKTRLKSTLWIPSRPF